MSEITPKIIALMSNAQVEAELGRRVRRRRVERGLNQTELADSAGVGRRTVSAVENGQGCSMSTFVALMRALGDLQELDLLLPDPEVSPLALTAGAVKERKYPYKPRGGKREQWKWGDEKA